MRADIFCRVVDNYGDIGVTWRLARQLQRECGWSIRLWVDTLESFKKLNANVDLSRSMQGIDDIEIVHWSNPAIDLTPHPIVIASFSCALPQSFQARMLPDKTLWINLEYLSAEAWVEGCHALPSLRSDGLHANFFFPGFTANTGGLIKESGLLAARDTWQADPDRQIHWIKSLGVSPEGMQAWQSGRLISVFCYPQAPLQAFFKQLTDNKTSTLLLIPQGVASDIPSGQHSNLHIYPQTEDTHLIKLDAWLTRTTLADFVKSCIRNWNSEDTAKADACTWGTLLEPATLSTWAREARHIAADLAKNPDLAHSLDLFCRTKGGL